jgi:hypothetical protein
MTHVYSDSEFKNIERKEYNLSLVKTDHNGTRYYEGVQKCWKCNGAKQFDCWGHVCGGVCFACNGTGVNPCKVKVMTDEHYRKLEDKRIAKQNKAIEERKAHASEFNAEFFKREGFNSEGKIWAIVKTGFVSKEFQEEMISKGAKKYGWNIYLFSEPQEGAIELDAKECCYADLYGVYNDFESSFMNQLIVDAQEKERQAKAEKSSYFGNVGDKVDGLKVTFKNVFFYETQFGSMCIYIFEDADGHQFKWNTSGGFGTHLEKEEVITIKATIKEHSEYNGIKQTVLTRCKLVA